MTDVRWHQRYHNFKKGYTHLSVALQQTEFNRLETLGFIHTFEYVYELAWKTLQDYFAYQGYTKVQGPRACIQQAFKNGIVSDGVLWMEMLKKRELTGHTYIESTIEDLAESIRDRYFFAFTEVIEQLEKELTKEN